MSLTLTLPLRTMRLLESAALAEGVEVADYAAGVLRRNASLAKIPFRVAFAPLHDAVNTSGMTEAELDDLIDEAIADTRRGTPQS